MHEPRDAVADQAAPRPAPDSPARRDSPSLNDLRDRLARLHPNHPSSPSYPYRSPMPLPRDTPAPDDADDTPRDSPPPGERTDATPDQPDSDEPRTNPDGSWDWKGHHLSPDECRRADETLADLRTVEGRDENGEYTDRGLTPAMRRIEAQLDHGHLVDRTEDFALKSPDRFKEKLAILVTARPDAAPEHLARGIHDGIRYTLVLDFDHYTDAVTNSHLSLEAAGYEWIETKPSWHQEEYKGVNSRWRDPSGNILFEVQFHTEESWQSKQLTHVAYERIADPRTPVAEVEQLREYQREVNSAIRVPAGATEIPPHKNKLER